MKLEGWGSLSIQNLKNAVKKASSIFLDKFIYSLGIIATSFISTSVTESRGLSKFGILPVLSGPVILGFSQEDPGAVARVFRDFIKENEDLVVKGLGVSGEFIDADQLKRIASLPTKDQAISMLMALMLAPTEKLVRTLNEVPTKLTRVVSAVRDQKQ